MLVEEYNNTIVYLDDLQRRPAGYTIPTLLLAVPRASTQYAQMFQFEIFHEQLPLPVPCYDLLPVTEFTLGR